MGNIFGKGTNTTTTQQNANPISQGYYNQAFNTAANAANTPTSAVPLQGVAGLSSGQQAGIGQTNQYSQFGIPYINQALGLQSQAANPLTGSQIQNYYNPYQQQVVQSTQNQFDLMNKQALNNIQTNAAGQGAIGGSRAATVAPSAYYGAVLPGQEQAIAGLEQQGYAQALGTAAQQYQQNPQQAAFGIASTGVAGQNAGLQGAAAQFGAGNVQQQYGPGSQAGLNALYGQQLGQFQLPFQESQLLTQAAGSLGPLYGGTSQTTAPPPNQTAQYLGLGLGALGLFANRGGRIKNYDDGGAVIPYGGQSDLIHIAPMPTSGSGLLHGPPAPPAAPSQQGQQSQQPSPQSMMDNAYKAATKIRKDMGSWGSQPLSLSPDGSLPSASSPPGTMAPIGQNPELGDGLDPLHSSGGAVNGHDANGIYVPQAFADGGAPDFTLDENETAHLGLGQPVNWTPDQNAAVQAYVPSSNGVVARNPAFPRAAPSDDATLPPNSSLTIGQAPPGLVPPTTQAAGDQQQQPGDFLSGILPKPQYANQPGNFGLGYLSPDVKRSLMAAGLGMMASRSPFLGNAIGQGGLQGLQTYENERKQQLSLDQEAKKLAQQADQFQKSLAQQKELHMAMTPYQEAEVALKRRQQALAELQPVTVTDAIGMPHSMVKDPNTGQLIPYEQAVRQQGLQQGVAPFQSQPGASGAPTQGAKFRNVAWDIEPGLEYLAQPTADEIPRTANPQVLEGIDSGLAARVRAVDEGRMPMPTGAAQRMPQNIALMELLARYDPGFTAQDYATKLATRKDFTSGPTSKNITALNTVMQHVKELDSAAGDLNNWKSSSLGPLTGSANALTNWYRSNEQDPRLSRFDTAANAVANELERAFRGNTTAISGIEEWRKGLHPAMSPEQWQAARGTLIKLLSGRLESVTDQYNRGMGSAKEPIMMLSPAAAGVYKSLISPQTQQRPSGQAAPQQRQVGQTVTTSKGTFRWNGTGWDPVQ